MDWDQTIKQFEQYLRLERSLSDHTIAAYLNDVQEELMDAILYIQAAREELAETKSNGLPYYVSDIAS